MQPRLCVFLVVSFCLVGGSNLYASLLYEASYSYTQNGSTDYGNSLDSELEITNKVESTPISTYTFNAEAVPSTPFELKARAGFDIEIDQRGSSGVSWFDLAASARAKSTLIDFGIVQDFGGATGGLIQFTWIVTGTSDILLDATGPNLLLVQDLNTSGILTSNVDTDVPDILINDVADNRFVSGSGSNAKIESLRPEVAEFQEFFVPWEANSEVPVFFELDVQSTLEVQNFDAAGFRANVDADFSNTATLDQVRIFDADGNLLPQASLIGQEGLVYVAGEEQEEEDDTSVVDPLDDNMVDDMDGANDMGNENTASDPAAVPEPATVCIWLALGFIATLRERHRRKRS